MPALHATKLRSVQHNLCINLGLACAFCLSCFVILHMRNERLQSPSAVARSAWESPDLSAIFDCRLTPRTTIQSRCDEFKPCSRCLQRKKGDSCSNNAMSSKIHRNERQQVQHQASAGVLLQTSLWHMPSRDTADTLLARPALSGCAASGSQQVTVQKHDETPKAVDDTASLSENVSSKAVAAIALAIRSLFLGESASTGSRGVGVGSAVHAAARVDGGSGGGKDSADPRIATAATSAPTEGKNKYTKRKRKEGKGVYNAPYYSCSGATVPVPMQRRGVLCLPETAMCLTAYATACRHACIIAGAATMPCAQLKSTCSGLETVSHCRRTPLLLPPLTNGSCLVLHPFALLFVVSWSRPRLAGFIRVQQSGPPMADDISGCVSTHFSIGTLCRNRSHNGRRRKAGRRRPRNMYLVCRRLQEVVVR